MNKALRVRVWILAGLLALCLLSAFLLHSEWNAGKRSMPASTASVPARNQVVGNTENGRQVLRRLFSAYEVYKKKHGHYPGRFGDIFADVQKEPQAFGFKDFGDMSDKLRNSDARLSNDPMSRNVVSFAGSSTRPDGTPKFGPKPEGTRDVLAYSTLCYHFGKGTDASGFIQVLWDDGTVEDVPVNKLLSVPVAGKPGFYDNAFPGQAGLPDNTKQLTDRFVSR